MLDIPKFVGWPLVAACAYGALYFLANRSIYYPLKHPQGFWELQSQAGAQDAWLKTADGVRLHAWWIPCLGSRLVTLYLHGNAGNITHRVEHAREITAAGSSLLLLDYRGYGKSEGSPNEKGLYADADAGYAYLLASGFDAGQIIAHGESLGTGVAVHLAARRPCAGVVLEAPFTSGSDVAGRRLPLIGPLVVWSYNTRRKIPHIHAPLLIIHGDRDEIVPFEMGKNLFAEAREPKTFWAVPAGTHNELLAVAGPEYRARLRAFYQRLPGRS
jgi:fermentation-respiration switch protein FrsA (DUF1100 family)